MSISEQDGLEGVVTAVSRRGRRSRKFGFTLIELLVVVSIIALLISILLPSLKRSREQARSVKCLSNVRGLGQAAFIFSEDHRGRFQLSGAEEAINNADPNRAIFEYDEQGEILSWPVALAAASGLSGYNNNWRWGVRANDWVEAKGREQFMSPEFELAICPSDRVKISTPFYPRDASLKPIPDYAPKEVQGLQGNSLWGFLSYGINEDIVGSADNTSDFPDCWRNGRPGQSHPDAGARLEGRLERVFDPGTCLLLVDAGPDTDVQARDERDNFANLIISAQAARPDLAAFQRAWEQRLPEKRHPNGRLNVLFADFHGETVRPTQFITGQLLDILGPTYAGLPLEYNTRVRVSPYRPWIE